MAQLFGLSEELKFKFKGLERWLRALIAFPEDPGLILGTRIMALEPP